MNSPRLILLGVIALLASAAQGQAIRIAVPEDVPLPDSAVTRAAILADYHMWRLAGLHDFHRREATPDSDSLLYRQAEARYARLRASPQFDALVTELAQRPSARVLAERARPDVVGLSPAR